MFTHKQPWQPWHVTL